LIFAIGVAFGLADDHRGEVALVGGVFFLVLKAMTMEHSLPEMMYSNVLTFSYKTGTAPDEVTHIFSQLFYVPVMDTDGTTIKGAVYVLDIGVLGGITSGVLSAVLYNRFKSIKLPTALSFFGGRRFVPMLALVVAIPTAIAFAAI
jgi:PTS system N-acetylglucosamine-specific IIC component